MALMLQFFEQVFFLAAAEVSEVCYINMQCDGLFTGTKAVI